ncbi:SAV_6107 family HEPN domain-containing protein [Amycolatopsis minnesotensis]|uniref:SAV-6107-like HEPN domain-containing protein n=1 Tax=Amycolatopsis minnesotensis TaxID=337894 RepID=A0ABN2Q9U5_9PSEU
MPEANTRAADGRQCALPLGPVPHAIPLDAFAAPITRRGTRITKSRRSRAGGQGVLPVTGLVAAAPFAGAPRPSRQVPRAGTAPEPSHPARAEHGARHSRQAPLTNGVAASRIGAMDAKAGDEAAAGQGPMLESTKTATGQAPAQAGPVAEDAAGENLAVGAGNPIPAASPAEESSAEDAAAPAGSEAVEDAAGSPAGGGDMRIGVATQPELPMPVGPPVAPAAIALLAQARRGLVEAETEVAPAPRFIAAYLAALRAAAAVLAARGRPHRGRAKPASVWLLLDSTVPELAEWAGFFAAHSATQAAAQAGISRKVTAKLADDLLAQVARFLELAKHAVHHQDEPAAEPDVPAQRRGVCAAPPVGAPKNRRG